MGSTCGAQHAREPEHEDQAPVEIVDGVLNGLNAVVIRPGKLDRSPCGTGCSARMAILHARGQMKIGDRYLGRSIIGSVFDCRIESQRKIGNIEGISPIISGTAWITGTHQHTLDPSDPFPAGYRLSDTWPKLGQA